jgi:hypothetical protein
MHLAPKCGLCLRQATQASGATWKRRRDLVKAGFKPWPHTTHKRPATRTRIAHGNHACIPVTVVAWKSGIVGLRTLRAVFVGRGKGQNGDESGASDF